jgi:hypothetical protein
VIVSQQTGRLMVHFIDLPKEQTTAATDFVLALMSFAASVVITRSGKSNDPKKTAIWAWVLRLLAIASVFGAIAHGFQMSHEINFILWQPLNLSLGLMIALIVVGVVYDLKGFSLPRQLLPVVLSCGLVFYIVTIMFPGSFLVFILYEAVAMLFAFIAYLVMALSGKLKGSWLMSCGIFVTIIAAAIQADNNIKLDFIWDFDHNGVFHIVQMIGLVLLMFGLRMELLSRSPLRTTER